MDWPALGSGRGPNPPPGGEDFGRGGAHVCLCSTSARQAGVEGTRAWRDGKARAGRDLCAQQKWSRHCCRPHYRLSVCCLVQPRVVRRGPSLRDGRFGPSVAGLAFGLAAARSLGVWFRQASGSAPGEHRLEPGGSKIWYRIRSANLRINLPKQCLPRVTWALDGSSSDGCAPLTASAVRLAGPRTFEAGFPTLLAGIAAAPIRLNFSVQFQRFISETCGLVSPFRHLKAAPRL